MKYETSLCVRGVDLQGDDVNPLTPRVLVLESVLFVKFNVAEVNLDLPRRFFAHELDCCDRHCVRAVVSVELVRIGEELLRQIRLGWSLVRDADYRRLPHEPPQRTLLRLGHTQHRNPAKEVGVLMTKPDGVVTENQPLEVCP